MKRTLLSALCWLSPAVALGSSGGGHGEEGIPWSSIGFHAINLAILLGILIWLARRPISDALRNRATEVRLAIEDAQRTRDEAQAQITEMERKLATFQSEVEKLQEETHAEAEKEHLLIIERAEREVATIRSSAERAIREETARARRAIQEEAVLVAVKLAEEILRQEVTATDKERLASQLLAALHRDVADGVADGFSNGSNHGA